MARYSPERFCDRERLDLYAELIQSSFDRPQGMEQAYLLDRIDEAAGPRPEPPARPRISLRWVALPRLPVPFLTWA